VERFSTLFDQLKAYQPKPDYHYYITRFVDGLRDDIRAVVTLQRPQTLDTAYSLALLQEEVADCQRKPDWGKPGYKANFRNAHPPPYQLLRSQWMTSLQYTQLKINCPLCAIINEPEVSMNDVLRSGFVVTNVQPLSSYMPCKRYGNFSISKTLKICWRTLLNSFSLHCLMMLELVIQ
jgi:hypothetical protein